MIKLIKDSLKVILKIYSRGHIGAPWPAAATLYFGPLLYVEYADGLYCPETGT